MRTNLDSLEARRLLSAESLELSHVPGACCCAGCALPPDAGKWDFEAASAAGAPEMNVPLSELPLLDSNPGAPVDLVLDFDGRNVPSWSNGTPGQQPAYTTDSDATTYSPQELSNIQEIWRRVAEKYSPFRVNVTTRQGNAPIAGQSFVIMISGNGSWYGNAGGVAFVNGFQSGGTGGIGWVFSAQNPNNLQFVAEAAAHEAGHGFGLRHQSTYNGGTLSQEYNPGNALRAPTMGNSYSTRRGLWWVGPSSGLGGGTQTDLDLLSRPANNFGYRADEAGGTLATAADLPLDGFTVSAQGILTSITDVDLYRFEAGLGLVSLSVAGPTAITGANIGMIDPSMAILDSLGNVVASSATANANEAINFNVTSPGVYYLRVSSHGQAGDIGTYLMNGAVPSANLPSAPTSVAIAPESDFGFSNNDGITNDTTPTITGFAQPGSTVRLYREQILLGTATASPEAVWEITTPALGDGTYSLVATAQDVRGTSPNSQTAVITIETVAPAAVSNGFEFQQRQELQFTFNEAVSGSINAGSIQLLSVPTLAPVSASFDVIDAGTTTLLIPTETLANGNYRAIFAPGTVTDAAGNTATGLAPLDFFVLAGDANRSRTVDLPDFTLLAANFSRTGRTFSQGDFNYDDLVNLDDFTLLAANFGRSVPAPADLPRGTPLTPGSSPLPVAFSNTAIDRQRAIELIDTPIV